jgi:TetR/AcrR family transcriptional regulator
MIDAEKEKVQELVVRERLLAASLELFTCKGYAATSVREIVASARVTKPVLYYYFGSKEGLYLELMREPYGQFEALIDASSPQNSKRVGELLLDLGDSLFQLFVEHLDTARLMYSIYYGPPQGAPFFDFDMYHRKLQEKVRMHVDEGIRSGEFSLIDANDMTWVIVGALNVALEEQLCHVSPGIDRQGLARILRLVIGSIAGARVANVE